MKQRDLLFLLISSTFLAVVWIIFSILHNALTSTINTSLNQQIQPIVGTFDNKTIQALQKRLPVTPQSSFVGSNQLTPTPTPTIPPAPTANPTGLNITPTIIITTPTQSATQSGQATITP